MKTTWSVSSWGLVALAAATFTSTEARADNAAVAEALFRSGSQLLEQGKVDEACPKLADSHKLDPALGTLLYLAICHEKQGHSASAWSEFSTAKQWAERLGQADRAALARRHLSELEPKLSTLVIAAPTLPGLELRIDDGVLSAAVLGTPLPLDPGDHIIEASAPGYEKWRTTITISSEASKLTITVPALSPSPALAAPAPSSAPSVSAAPPTSSPADTGATAHASSISPVLTWTAVGVGAAGLVVGSVFGAMTFSARDSSKSQCPGGQCTGSGLSDADHARTYATVSTVGFVVGLAGAAASVYLLIRSANESSSTPPAAARSWTIIPGVGPGQAGLVMRAQF